MIQYMCFIGGIKHPAGDDGCERVDEVAATDGVTALDRSVVYFKSVFVLFRERSYMTETVLLRNLTYIKNYKNSVI